MPKQALVVKRDVLFNGSYFQGFMPKGQTDFIPIILSKFEYYERGEKLENDPSLQQIIPYIWIVNPKAKKVFAYKRSVKGYSESRLMNKWSCGIGGHIDKEDSKDPIQNGMMRELKEEVKIKEYPQPKIIGFINDDSDVVNQVHFGVVAVAETDFDVEKNDEEISEGRLYTLKDLEKIFSDPQNDVEKWTKISWPVVKAYALCLFEKEKVVSL